ncbi:MAG: MFS transporter [Acidimicrobiales bacterium]
MAVGDRVDQFRELARHALQDLFDQREPFGRLALVQVLMLAGDTLVTISLAGSLFFSISPHAAKDRVFLYLVLTIAPFAVVSPLLGPLIDKSRGARRAMVVFSALGRAALCALMASHTNDLLLFPLAFFVLVLSKLYLVTRGALVPEMVAAGTAPGTGWAAAERPLGPEGEIGVPARTAGSVPAGYAALNARLTLLGTVAGFVASVPGVILLKLAGAPGVLVFDAFVFLGAAVAGSRLPVPRRRHSAGGRGGTERTPPARSEALDGAPAAGAVDAGWDEPSDRDLARLQQAAHPEVLLGLTTMSLIRGLAGFLVFLLAFGLRREHASLWWYGLALAGSGVGALLGLLLVSRIRQRLIEQQILLLAVWLIAGVALGCAFWGTAGAQVVLAFFVGLAGSLAQPSFDAMTQQLVPPAAQGHTFARFATRQQLVWVVGAIIPVVVAFPFPAGDAVMAAVGGAGGVFYVTSRRALRHRALPRGHGRPPG